jgi:RNA polymerase sigma factor (sigma-70 family)
MGEHTRSAQDQNDDLERVEAALGGDEAAAAEIRSGQANAQIEAILRNRGASPTEAADLTADLWADCFGERGGRRPLLEKFTGKGPLGAFLTRTALNRLIDFKRRQKFRGQLPGSDDADAAGDAFDRLPGEQAEDDSEDRLVGMLREALMKAFANIDPEKLAIMKLVNVHGLEQGQVAKMWGWSQSKVSRNISAVMDSIRDDTMAELKRMDPWLELHWEDFIALCKDSTSLFGDMDDAA